MILSIYNNHESRSMKNKIYLKIFELVINVNKIFYY